MARTGSAAALRIHVTPQAAAGWGIECDAWRIESQWVVGGRAGGDEGDLGGGMGAMVGEEDVGDGGDDMVGSVRLWPAGWLAATG